MYRLSVRIKYKQGFSLIELMLLLALIVIFALSASRFYVFLQQQQQKIMLKLELQYDVHLLLKQISKDIQRSGYRALSPDHVNTNWELFYPATTTNIIIGQFDTEATNSCVIFSYDLNKDGCLGRKVGSSCRVNQINQTKDLATELFGYRLRQQVLEKRNLQQPQVHNACNSVECQRYVEAIACNTGAWYAILDHTKYQVMDFKINFQASTKLVSLEIRVITKQLPKFSYQMVSMFKLLN